MVRKWLLLFLVGGLVLLLDQGAKLWIVQQLEVGQTMLPIPALHPYFQFTRTVNTGIAFGLGSGSSTFFLILSLIITGGLFFLFSQSARNAYLQQTALALVLGGAIGNIIDRVRLGHVIDFFHVVIPPLNISNVSNFADHAIVIGVGLLLIDSFMQERRERNETARIQTSSTGTDEASAL